MAVLPLDDIVDIQINLSPKAAVRSGFNLAMVLGTSGVITPDERVAVYMGLDAMAEAGFTQDMPEYKAAQIYFMQSSGPRRLAVGRWDDTAEETIVDALAACREKNRDWYACIPLDATPEQVTELAAVIESIKPAALLCYTTRDLELLKKLKGLSYRRSFGQYSMTENAVCGIVGWAMGATTGLAGSAYTLLGKQLVGIPADDLTSGTVEEIQKSNGNYYVCRGALYNLFERGVMADGTWFDEMLHLDMLENNLHLSLMDLIVQNNKIPQTEGGVNMIKAALMEPLDKMVRMGFLAGGIWKGAEILTLHTGDAIEDGYLILSESVDSQPQADRENRLAPPVYIAIKLAGAVHNIVVQVNVNR